jgi:hypothetical protein
LLQRGHSSRAASATYKSDHNGALKIALIISTQPYLVKVAALVLAFKAGQVARGASFRDVAKGRESLLLADEIRASASSPVRLVLGGASGDRICGTSHKSFHELTGQCALILGRCDQEHD